MPTFNKRSLKSFQKLIAELSFLALELERFVDTNNK